MEQVVDIPELQEDIELGQALQKLKKNKDFKKIFLDMYLNDGSNYLTSNIAITKNREAVYEQLIARSWLYRFIHEIEARANDAALMLEQLNEEEEV